MAKLPRRRRPDPDLEDLWLELLKGNIWAGPIKPLGQLKNLLGTCSPRGRICIDERVNILTTVIHELIHRRRPDLPEREVLRLEGKIRRGMTQEQLERWWHAYERLRHQRPLLRET